MTFLKELFSKIPQPLKNKYLITLFIFILWILFIDNYNIISQYKTYKQIKTLEEKQVFYETEIEKDSIKLYHLKHVKKEQERFAREKFLMKKENEELFIIKQDDGK